MTTRPKPEESEPTARQWLRAQCADLRDDCEYLLRAYLGWDRNQLHCNGDQALANKDRLHLNTQVQRLSSGEPLAYLLGEQPFHNISVLVDSRVLIPRSDTETLVELALRHCEQNIKVRNVLDLGTGSGAIAIALATAAPALAITATDASPEALALAGHNAQRCQADIRFLASDWFTEINERFDLIVSTPPYIAMNDPHLQALQHEPMQALVSGEDGLKDLRTIIAEATGFLNPEGVLMVEHGYDQQEAVAALFKAAGYTRVDCERDLGNRPRVTQGQWMAT